MPHMSNLPWIFIYLITFISLMMLNTSMSFSNKILFKKNKLKFTNKNNKWKW